MKTRYIVYAALVLVVAFLIFNKFHGAKNKDGSGPTAGAAKNGKRKNGPVPVKVMIVKDTSVSNNIDLTGTIDPNEKVNLVAQTSGNITGIYFQEGSHVSKGQVLVKVYNQDLIASLKQNQYQVALAKENEYRNRVLLQKEAVSQQEYDTSLSSFNSLKAQSDVIKAQIARTEIRAPFTGTIGLRSVSPGSYLSPQTSIATLVSTDPMKVTFSVPERYKPLITVNSKIKFNIASSQKTFTGTVYAVEPAIDPTSRTLTVRARAANPKGEITAGGFAKINLTLDQTPRTIMVPTECVVPDIKSSKVFIAQNGKAVAKTVQTDLRTDTQIEIVSGLKAGDSLIVSGIIQMRPKVPLKIIKVIK
ncbi:efflux RND transporter periplasmic adaptor subunit [Mucilaginibacter sp. RS28]|uniref:Efflux RND transporter periplasmic adaptor subunit n=1 Tax=Mucilaginibacter straminoryzae TaxID=2932774 RepID=A0A9X1X474_9SPHI|nr:efflux RND transporter periplasmic adaptor subunit [Mucilaginibacter straminoryzae]MCJ8208204.1 efflux RND transporter periplasmic adaptor subunit [Mucilaginibacter straminoryzae]